MRYLLSRLGLYLVALWGSLTINFLLPRSNDRCGLGWELAHSDEEHHDLGALGRLRDDGNRQGP